MNATLSVCQIIYIIFVYQNKDELLKIKKNKFEFDDDKLTPLRDILLGDSELMKDFRSDTKSFVEDFINLKNYYSKK